MARTERDYTVVKGADWRVDFVIVDKNGNVVNLAGASTRALLKESKEDADDDAAATITVTITDEDAGEVRLTLSDDQTLSLSPRKYYWDLMVETSDGWVDYPLGGVITISQPVTRSLS